MVPKGWTQTTVSAVSDVVSVGIVVNPSHYYVDASQGVKAFRSQNVRENSVNDSNWVHISAPGHEKNRKSILRTGDVVVVRTGFAGVACVVPREFDGVNCIDVLFARPRQTLVISEYLCELTNSELGRKQVLAGQSGLAQKHLNVSAYERLSFPLPPLDEQRRVVAILNTWNAAIAASEKLLINRIAQKFALLSELLMPVPTPGRGRVVGDAYPLSVQSGIPRLPPPPTGWRTTALAHHLTEVVRPAALSGQEPYTLVTVRRSRGGVEKRSVLLGSQIKTPTQFYVKSGDFLISKRQIVHGACGIVPKHLDGAIVSNEYAVLNTDDRLDARFLAYLAETTYFQQTCFHSSIGVHIEKMLFNLERWLSWPFNIPPLEVQLRIVEQLDFATEEIRLAERQVELLKTEKQALMADLLTGRRRVRLQAVGEEAREPA